MPKTKQPTEAQKEEYMKWLATPLSRRAPPNHAELAAKMGIAETDLWRLRHSPNFTEELGPYLKQALIDLLPDLIGSYLESVKQANQSQAAKLFEELGILRTNTIIEPPKVIIGIDPEKL